MAQKIAQEYGLEDWAANLFGFSTSKVVNGKSTPGPSPPSHTKSVNNELRQSLLKILLEVYMDTRCELWELRYSSSPFPFFRQSERAAHLVNSQGINLDTLDVCFLLSSSKFFFQHINLQVISNVPSHWSLNMITPFLSHSLRRLLHAEQEGKILKNISAGQNLEVDRFFLLFICGLL